MTCGSLLRRVLRLSDAGPWNVLPAMAARLRSAYIDRAARGPPFTLFESPPAHGANTCYMYQRNQPLQVY